MKKKILLYFQFIPLFSLCQQISVEYSNILTYASKYVFIGVKYQPDYLSSNNINYLRDVYESSQSSYDKGHAICSREYFKLLNLKLINVDNQKSLESYRKVIVEWTNANFKHVDFSLQSNINKVLDHYNRIYEIKSIKDELRLLKDLDSYYLSILKADPLKEDKGKMFDVLNTILEKMKYWDANKLSRSFNEIIIEVSREKFINFKNEVIDKYSKQNKKLKIPNGWYYVSMLSKNDPYYSYGKRSVYVNSGKITIYRNFSGNEFNIISGGNITNNYCSYAIYRQMNTNGVFIDVEVEFYFTPPCSNQTDRE